MLSEIAMSVEIVIILRKTAKILDFMQKHYSVATFVHINLPKSYSFSRTRCNLAFNRVIMVV